MDFSAAVVAPAARRGLGGTYRNPPSAPATGRPGAVSANATVTHHADSMPRSLFDMYGTAAHTNGASNASAAMTLSASGSAVGFGGSGLRSGAASVVGSAAGASQNGGSSYRAAGRSDLVTISRKFNGSASDAASGVSSHGGVPGTPYQLPRTGRRFASATEEQQQQQASSRSAAAGDETVQIADLRDRFRAARKI
jgi:hypothetical protein